MRKIISRLLKEDKFFKYFAWVATILVIYLSIKPPSPDSKSWNFLFFRGDLILHFVCYFGLSIIYFLSFNKLQRAAIKSLILSSSLGIILELVQLIPFFQRFFDINDIIANFIGAATGILFIRFLFLYSAQE